jgi:hypothetical protein
MSGNGWTTVTRKRGHKSRTPTPAPSSNRKTRSARNGKQFFPNWFEDEFPDELAMIGAVNVEAGPRRRPMPLDPADKVKVQQALVNVFRDGYIKNVAPEATDNDILTFLNDFLRRNRICISGGFILKNIGAFAEGTGSSSIDVDIYIPSSRDVPEIHRTLQELFHPDRKPDGKPKVKVFKVRTDSRSSKASFFAKNGIYSVSKYEKTLPPATTMQVGGTSSSSNSNIEKRRRKAAQDLWAAAVRSGTAYLAMQAIDQGGFTHEIDGQSAMEVMLAGNPNPEIFGILLKTEADLVPNIAFRIVGLPIAEQEIIRMLEYAQAGGLIGKFKASTTKTPLEQALLQNLPAVTTYLLELGVSPLSVSSIDPSKTIYEMVEAAAYPPDASAAFKAFMTNPATEYRSRAQGNTFYTKFKATEAIRRPFVAEAATQITTTGPVCSTEGSYQHHGECWNDAAHMLFLYADGLKEYTQPALLTGDLTEMARKLNNGTADGALRAKQMRVYLEATQSRFARQVLNQVDNDATCRRDIAEAIRAGYGSRRAGGTNAMVAAVMGAPRRKGAGTVQPFEETLRDYVAGYYPQYLT